MPNTETREGLSAAGVPEPERIHPIGAPAQVNVALPCSGTLAVTVTDPLGAPVPSSGAVVFVPRIPGTHTIVATCGALVEVVRVLAAWSSSTTELSMVDTLDGEDRGQSTLRGTLVFGSRGWVSGDVVWTLTGGMIARSVERRRPAAIDANGLAGTVERLIGFEDEVLVLGTQGIARVRYEEDTLVRSGDLAVPSSYRSHNPHLMNAVRTVDGAVLLSMPETGTMCRLGGAKPICAQVPGRHLGPDESGFWIVGGAVPTMLFPYGAQPLGGLLCHVALGQAGATQGACTPVPRDWSSASARPRLVPPIFDTCAPQSSGCSTTTHKPNQVLVPREVDGAIEFTLIEVPAGQSILGTTEQRLVAGTGYPTYEYRSYGWRDFN